MLKSEYTKNQVEFFAKTKEMFPGTASFKRSQLLQVKENVFTASARLNNL